MIWVRISTRTRQTKLGVFQQVTTLNKLRLGMSHMLVSLQQNRIRRKFNWEIIITINIIMKDQNHLFRQDLKLQLQLIKLDLRQQHQLTKADLKHLPHHTKVEVWQQLRFLWEMKHLGRLYHNRLLLQVFILPRCNLHRKLRQVQHLKRQPHLLLGRSPSCRTCLPMLKANRKWQIRIEK